MNEKACYCGTGKSFGNCCEPILKGESKALTALALMRSRYSAHATVATSYLVATNHSSIRNNQSSAEIESWAKENKWQKLEIISTTLGGEKHETGQVEFKAYFTNPSGKIQVHHENSSFIKESGQWFYSKGIINPKPVIDGSKTGRNDPCPCGSGLKHKKCCG